MPARSVAGDQATVNCTRGRLSRRAPGPGRVRGCADEFVKGGEYVERLGGIGALVGAELERLTGKETRTTVLGHLQRGGSPTVRLHGTGAGAFGRGGGTSPAPARSTRSRRRSWATRS